MFCINCGANLPDESNFCLKCGKSQKQGDQDAKPVQARETWETCEIVADNEGDNTILAPVLGRFWAKAIAPEGSYFVACSDSFKMPQDTPRQAPSHIQALDQLTSTLTQAGWLSLTRGEHWYSQQFRRLIGTPEGRRPDDGKRFDVILEQTHKQRVFQVPLRLVTDTQLSPDESVRIVKRLPAIVASRVPLLKAEGFRLRLETLYCKVLVQPSS